MPGLCRARYSGRAGCMIRLPCERHMFHLDSSTVLWGAVVLQARWRRWGDTKGGSKGRWRSLRARTYLQRWGSWRRYYRSVDLSVPGGRRSADQTGLPAFPGLCLAIPRGQKEVSVRQVGLSVSAPV